METCWRAGTWKVRREEDVCLKRVRKKTEFEGGLMIDQADDRVLWLWCERCLIVGFCYHVSLLTKLSKERTSQCREVLPNSGNLLLSTGPIYMSADYTY